MDLLEVRKRAWEWASEEVEHLERQGHKMGLAERVKLISAIANWLLEGLDSKEAKVCDG